MGKDNYKSTTSNTVNQIIAEAELLINKVWDKILYENSVKHVYALSDTVYKEGKKK